MTVEYALTLEEEGKSALAGIVHPGIVHPGTVHPGIVHPGAETAELGVLVVVGGPQYRVGSHRQFVHLARDLAAAGVPVMRFDITGMGDSGGDKKSFEDLDEDIRRGIDGLLAQLPGLRGVVLWGLCDGASAALMYAPRDHRVRGLVLVNPWLENSEARARTHLWDYYRQRLLSPSFWRRLVAGRLALVNSARELLATSRSALGRGAGEEESPEARPIYQTRMLRAFEQLDIPLCWLLSGQDLTAGEFERHYRADARWRKAAAGKRIDTRRFPEADHTFSRREWKKAAAAATLDFIKEVQQRRES